MRHALVVLSLASLVACKKGGPAPAYLGTVTERARVQVETGAPAPPGQVNVQWWNTDRPRGNVRVTFTPAGDRRYRMALPGCTVEVEMDPEPNEQHGQLALTPQPVCEVDVDHYRGPMRVGGNVQYDRTTRALQVTVSGNNNQLSPHVEWSLTYEGRAE